MLKLHTVYDIRNESLIPWEAYFFFALMALALTIFYHTPKFDVPEITKIRRTSLIMSILSFVVVLCFAANAERQDARIKRIFDGKNYSIVEGRVQDYHPMPASGHDTERFRVGDLYFTICDYDATIFGYNNAASLGGAIRANLYVRILYPTYGQIGILRLETE